MENTLITIQIILAFALIFCVLVQKTSSDGLSGLTNSSSGGHGIISGRSSANFLNKLTWFLALLFIANCLLMANITTKAAKKNTIIESIKEKPIAQPEAPLAE